MIGRFHRTCRTFAASMLMTLTLVVFTPAAAGEAGPAKVALVMGNQRYAGEYALPNAGNDARLMSRTLTALGFAVTERYDLERAQFAAAVTEFTERIPRDATALVYYAGHGMQINGSNYLNPVDMQLTSEQATPLRAYPVRSMLERLALSKSAVNIVILDACRNNPFRPRGDVRYRSFRDLGLSRMPSTRGTLIAYSTAPGQLAADGSGKNSIYTETLARTLVEPGYEIEEIFKRVSNEVRRKTLDDQIPWYESSLAGRYVLKAPSGGAPAPAPTEAAAPKLAMGKSMHRGASADSREDALWFRQMTASDWSRVDWEIQQRVKRLTADEIPALEHKASADSVMAQTILGLVYRDGIEKATDVQSGRVTRFRSNNTKAWHWLKKAAKAGFPVAQAEVGEMYYTGHGTDRDLQASRYWLTQASEANYPRARLDLLQLGLESSASPNELGAAMSSIMESLKAMPGQPSPRK